MILLVDDDPNFLQSAGGMFGVNSSILMANDSHGAMALVRAIGFSVALVDLHLADENGFELIQKMHEQVPSLPIIAISGVFSSSVLQSAREFGASEVLPKPVTPAWAKVISRFAQPLQ